MVISSLGALQCERAESSPHSTVENKVNPTHVEQVLQQQLVSHSKNNGVNSEEDKAKVAIKFPNIFDVFRSIF